MCIVQDLEGHKQVLNFFLFVFPDSVAFAFDLNVGGVLEERCWGSVLENRLEKGGLTRLSLEDTVGETALLSSDKVHVQRVVKKEPVHLQLYLILKSELRRAHLLLELLELLDL